MIASAYRYGSARIDDRDDAHYAALDVLAADEASDQ